MIYSPTVENSTDAVLCISNYLDAEVQRGHARKIPCEKGNQIGYTLLMRNGTSHVILEFDNGEEGSANRVSIDGSERAIRFTKSRLLKLVDGLELY